MRPPASLLTAAAVLIWCSACAAPSLALAQDALRGKRLYHDIGRLNGAGVSCIDCHGGIPGALHGLGKAANNPSAIDYAINAVHQMTPLRDRVSAQDMADLAAYIGAPQTPSPDLRIETSGPAANAYTKERLTFRPGDSAIVRITNAGALPLTLLSGPEISGRHASVFTIAPASGHSNCSAGISIPTGGSCAITLMFTAPAGRELNTASFGVRHDWIGGRTSIALIGLNGSN